MQLSCGVFFAANVQYGVSVWLFKCSMHVCFCKCVCPLQFPQGSWSPPQQTDDFATLWLKHLLQPLTGRHTPGHTPLSGRPQLLPKPHSDHFTQILTSTHTHAETQGRVTLGTPAFLLGYGDVYHDALWRTEICLVFRPVPQLQNQTHFLF